SRPPDFARGEVARAVGAACHDGAGADRQERCMAPQDVELGDGRVATVHLDGSLARGAPMLVVHYGTPHTGRHPARIAGLATDLGLGLLSVTRPGFSGSPRRPGRTVADTAADVVEVLDRLGVDQVVTAGYSGGGPHALALAALRPDRV